MSSPKASQHVQTFIDIHNIKTFPHFTLSIGEFINVMWLVQLQNEVYLSLYLSTSLDITSDGILGSWMFGIIYVDSKTVKCLFHLVSLSFDLFLCLALDTHHCLIDGFSSLCGIATCFHYSAILL